VANEVQLSIGEVAERLSLSVHALRFYEREGLLAAPVRRGAGGWRVYNQDDIEWLEVCLILRGSGMPLPAIRRYTELVRQGVGNERERRDLLAGHREDVLAQIGALHRCLDLVNFKIGVYDDILAPTAEPATM
jgi:DNA-binding transcriptional MerR regulator